MKIRMPVFVRPVALAALIVLSSAVCAAAQNVSFRYIYKFESALITEPPEIPGGPDFNYPENARKKGIEGKAVVSFTLGEDGKVRNVKLIEGLPEGVSEALMDSVRKLYFKPAKNGGVPAPIDVTVTFTITLVFDESDPNVKKPKITLLPPAVYPESQRAEKYKDKVAVLIIFYPDGTLKVNGVNSILPKEFDEAAKAAAEDIKFEPAVHKKSQKPVAQAMYVEFNFKP
ncbi:MAG TPA: energy transducer TonB [Pyrinomonadaceae bacterium]|jgi:TonB family protein|nr:energy transducer TonB [Pyrinomonadaceae bacterium]